jgi:hypothetical protein
VALADIRGWPLHYVESTCITLRLAIPAPPGPDGALRATATTADAVSTMTATIRLSTRPSPRPLADDLVEAAFAPARFITDSDRLPAPAGRAVAAWRQLPSLYRGAARLSAEALDHPSATAAVRAVENLTEAVCRWCAGGPPVDPRLIADAPHPEILGPDAPPALITLAATVRTPTCP